MRRAVAVETPVALASFVGREHEVAEVGRLLASTRLVTLTGAGGSGKTRLAIAAVQAHAPAARSWIELAGIAEPALVPQHVAEHLGLRELRGGAALEACVARLRDEPHLLVLDNCEHLIDAAARLVEALLVACPHLQVLATSREPLAVAGERAWLVPGLSLPPREAPSEPSASDALRLFVERARDVQPGFTLDASNAATIAEICRRVDGLPLAIELAAARVRLLSPRAILARLHDSFRLLTSGSRSAIPRHQTLRATMDWSYALLAPEEQGLLDRLSVFSGGFTLDAAEAACTDAQLGAEGVLDVLARLVDRSLVTMREVDGSARYALLEIVRQYAAERLRARGDESELQRRHAAYVTTLLADAEPHWIRASRPPWLARVHRELDNIRLALAWTRDHAPALHLELTGRLCWFWFASGAWAEAREWSEGALALPVATAPSRARAATLFSAAVIACMQADAAVARPWLEEVIALAGAHGDAQLVAYARNYLGMALVHLQDPASEAEIEAALTWFRTHQDRYGARLSLLLLGSLEIVRGNVARAVSLFEEGVAVAREFGLPRELAIALQMLASAALQRDQPADADRAAAWLHDALVALTQDPQYYFLARSLDMIGVLAARRGDAEDAARLMGAAETARRRIGARVFPLDHRIVAPWIAQLRTSLGDAGFDAAFAAGRALSPGDAVEHALARTRPRAAASPPTAAPASSSPRTRAELVVRGLGPLEVICGERRLDRDAWSSGRARELLLYLMLAPAGRRREDIGLAFWPDATAAQVKNSFHVLLHRLRKTLGRPDLVIVEDERYRINPAVEVWFDAAVFEREVRAARRDAPRLSAAIELYRGALFDGEVAGDWHFARQDQLRMQYHDALSALADLLLETDPQAATRTLEHLIAEDPVREDAHRRLLLWYARAGQRDRALQQFERLAAALRTELAAVPSRATVELVERIRRAETV